MKIMHIVGNRPQFIKLAPVSMEVRKRGHIETIIHTGQHFDENMSDVFFSELGIPAPTENLHISGGTHASMTGEMMIALEKTIISHAPDVVIVYGDTNSTLAAALTARKMQLPVVHIEAGPRTGNSNNPEEINRRAVDHISDLLFAPDQTSLNNLINEGQQDHAYFCGDVMYDAYRIYSEKETADMNLPGSFILMTWHRQENTSDKERMSFILDVIQGAGVPVVCPMHPRTRGKLREFGLLEKATNTENLSIIDPVGYFEMVSLMNRCSLTLTDSGGLSKESWFAKKKCIFMVDLLVWPELEERGQILHMPDNAEEAITMIKKIREDADRSEAKTDDGDETELFGDGYAAPKIMDEIERRY